MKRSKRNAEPEAPPSSELSADKTNCVEQVGRLSQVADLSVSSRWSDHHPQVQHRPCFEPEETPHLYPPYPDDIRTSGIPGGHFVPRIHL